MKILVNMIGIGLAIFVLIPFICWSGFLPQGEAQSTAEISVEPEESTVQIETEINMSIMVSDVLDLCSWQVYIYFLNQILEATAYSEGTFLNSHGATMFNGGIEQNFNSTHGRIWMYCLRTWPGYGVDGSGDLADIKLKGKFGGSSPIVLADTILGNSTAQRIQHTTNNGIIEVGKHDIAVTHVKPSKTVVSQGFLARINVTIGNIGNYTENFNVTLYINDTFIQRQSLLLQNGTSTWLYLVLNASGISKGNYSIVVVADIVPLETETEDNTYVDGWMFVSMPGDIDANGIVDIFDIVNVATAFGAVPTDPNWNPNANIVDDDSIDIFDIVVVATNFGQIDP